MTLGDAKHIASGNNNLVPVRGMDGKPDRRCQQPGNEIERKYGYTGLWPGIAIIEANANGSNPSHTDRSIDVVVGR
jgi:hypothetical protein